jgi:hypothetical protein
MQLILRFYLKKVVWLFKKSLYTWRSPDFFNDIDSKIIKQLRSFNYFRVESLSFILGFSKAHLAKAIVYRAISKYNYSSDDRACWELLSEALEIDVLVLSQFPQAYQFFSHDVDKLYRNKPSQLDLRTQLLLYRLGVNVESRQSIFEELLSYSTLKGFGKELIFFLTDYYVEMVRGEQGKSIVWCLGSLEIILIIDSGVYQTQLLMLLKARLLALNGEAERARDISTSLKGFKRLSSGSMDVMRLSFSVEGDVQGFYNCAHDGKQLLNKYFPGRYRANALKDISGERVAVFSVHGPGDVIRHASLIARISEKNDVTFYVDKKIQPIMAASLPGVNVKSSNRIFRLSYKGVNKSDLTMPISSLPDNRLSQFMDSSAFYEIKDDDGLLITTTLDLAINYSHEVINNEVNGSGYLCQNILNENPHPFMTDEVNKIKIGVSWRTAFVTPERKFYNLSMDSWAKIVSILVKYGPVYSLQFGLTDKELCNEVNYFEERANATITVVKDLDGFNDVSSLVDFILGLDVVVCHSNFIAELAAAIGKKVVCINPICLNNIWSNRDGKDYWFSSIDYINFNQVEEYFSQFSVKNYNLR